MLRNIRHFQRFAGVRVTDTQIGLIGAVFLHGCGIRNSRPRAWRHGFAIAEFAKNTANHWFNGCKNIFLLDKAHFQIELVEFTWQTIGARIFIAEAGSDLEIAVKTRHHQ